MTLTSGARLGAYEIVALIGAGGMGEVYKANDTRPDRMVAIKILPEALAANPQFRDRFDREARAISQLDHPHICAVYDVGEQHGTSYLVMQYLDGETLQDRLGKGALPLDQALTIAIQIASALDKAHRAGIVHRDLKPGNIMLTNSGAKLLDFGLAKTGGPAKAGHYVPGMDVRSVRLQADLSRLCPAPQRSRRRTRRTALTRRRGSVRSSLAIFQHSFEKLCRRRRGFRPVPPQQRVVHIVGKHQLLDVDAFVG